MVCINEKEVRGYLFPKILLGIGTASLKWNMRGGIHVFSDPALIVIPTGSDERGVLEGREYFCCNTFLLSVHER